MLKTVNADASKQVLNSAESSFKNIFTDSYAQLKRQTILSKTERFNEENGHVLSEMNTVMLAFTMRTRWGTLCQKLYRRGYGANNT
mmetsp:Transcript_67084/g.98148  ORF Transcript_67084/g.98148 Transcript_67084/m.98148 type:complete len:86 (-) Transcript_67084:982-1239(-)